MQGQDREPPTHHLTPDRGIDSSHVARRVLHQRAGAKEVPQVPSPHSPMPSPLFSDQPSGEAGGALGWPASSALTRTGTMAKSGDKTSLKSHHRSPMPSTLSS